MLFRKRLSLFRAKRFFIDSRIIPDAYYEDDCGEWVKIDKPFRTRIFHPPLPVCRITCVNSRVLEIPSQASRPHLLNAVCNIS